MNLRQALIVTSFLAALSMPAATQGQDRSPETLLAPQREAMKRLTYMNGVWRGPAWSIQSNGQKHHITQTERIGPFLGGAVKVIEGRGYEPDGKVSFNALGVVSYSPEKKSYLMRSYAQGRAGDFELKLQDDGFVWEIPAGPGMTIRYTATVKDGAWKEVGDRIVPGKEPVRFFEMNLKRIGDTDWPSAGVVAPK